MWDSPACASGAVKPEPANEQRRLVPNPQDWHRAHCGAAGVPAVWRGAQQAHAVLRGGGEWGSGIGFSSLYPLTG